MQIFKNVVTSQSVMYLCVYIKLHNSCLFSPLFTFHKRKIQIHFVLFLTDFYVISLCNLHDNWWWIHFSIDSWNIFKALDEAKTWSFSTFQKNWPFGDTSSKPHNWYELLQFLHIDLFTNCVIQLPDWVLCDKIWDFYIPSSCKSHHSFDFTSLILHKAHKSINSTSSHCVPSMSPVMTVQHSL